MSIQRQQAQAVMQEIVRRLYSSGKKPLLGEIFTELSAVFSKHPAGRPFYNGDSVINPNGISDVQQYNDNMSNILFDLSILYNTSFEQAQQLMLLNESLRVHAAQLDLKRRRIENRVDDYLLTLYNSDGYFYSFSDTFSDLDFTDLVMTSAYVDTSTGDITLPSVAGLTERINPTNITTPVIQVLDGRSNTTLPYRSLSPFANAMESGLDNVVWAIEVETTSQTEVIVVVDIPLESSSGDPYDLSKIIFSPYAIVPFQFFFGTRPERNAGEWDMFSSTVQTTLNKTTLLDEARSVGAIRLTMRKSKADYTQAVGGSIRYRYVFGAKEIEMFHAIYDNRATFVSSPILIAEDFADTLVIDAVSLVVQDESSSGCKVDYYLAADTTADSIDGFNWRPINPVGRSEAEQQIVRFDGAQKTRRKIQSHPSASDIQLTPLSTVADTSYSMLNPSPTYLPGDQADAYRICAFSELFLAGSISLEEGVNTVRSYHTPLLSEAAYDMSFWGKTLVERQLTPVHTRLDGGNDFLYGGDIGRSNVSVYSETYLYSQTEQTTFLAEFVKNDVVSRMWDVEIYLNGSKIGKLPVGVHRFSLPWTFHQGENHIVVISTIPAEYANGSVELMAGQNILDYGRVHLSTWNYVDIFDMRHNETGQPKTFTIYNGELISRRKPTDNYEVSYAQGTGKGPTAVRFRADLSRDFNNPSVSPKIASYISAPQFQRSRQRLRGQRESEKMNLEIAQLYYDIERLYERNKAIFIQLKSNIEAIDNGTTSLTFYESATPNTYSVDGTVDIATEISMLEQRIRLLEGK